MQREGGAEMSKIGDQRESLMALIDSATGITPSKWDGDPRSFDPKRLPAIAVMCDSGRDSASLEIGESTYTSVNHFIVLVATEFRPKDLGGPGEGDDVPEASAGDQALDILEQMGAALNETDIAVDGVADAAVCRPYQFPDWGGNTWTRIDNHAGRAGYAQAWLIEQVIG